MIEIKAIIAKPSYYVFLLGTPQPMNKECVCILLLLQSIVSVVA